MLILAMISFLVGVVLGLRFKVFILVPAIGLALAIVAVNGVVGSMVVVAAFIQLGYLSGIILRAVTCGTRAADHGGASMPPSTEVSPSGQFRNRAGSSSRFETSKHLRQA
jgi:hypothetical protein